MSLAEISAVPRTPASVSPSPTASVRRVGAACAVLVVCGLIARAERYRMHAMHAAVLVSLMAGEEVTHKSEWFELRHPEFLESLRELVERGQVEMVGGGFYEPIMTMLPALNPAHTVSSVGRSSASPD